MGRNEIMSVQRWERAQGGNDLRGGSERKGRMSGGALMIFPFKREKDSRTSEPVMTTDLEGKSS